MSKHTPTPWTVGHGPANEVEIWGRMQMNSSPILMSIGIMEHDPCEANAAFIVKAVNSHDSLVGALEGLVEAVRRDCDVRDKGISGYTAARLTDAKNILASIKEPA